MLAKVHCGRLLRDIMTLQGEGFKVKAGYGYNSRHATPRYVQIWSDGELKTEKIQSILNNGYYFAGIDGTCTNHKWTITLRRGGL